MLTHYPELTLDRWARKYGPLYSVRLGNQPFVIVSDPVIAKDLLVNNGAVFSDRKEMFIKSQTIFLGRGITATRYNDRWRKHRRIATLWLNPKAVDRYAHVLDFEATDMLKALYDNSKKGAHINPQTYAGRCSLNNMLTIAFGFRTASIHEPIVAEALRLSREFMNTTGPMANLVDFIPVLQKLPSPIKTRGQALSRDLVATYGGLIKDIDTKMKQGVPVADCLAKTMLEMQEEESLDDLDMAILVSAFLIGGVETTASVMQWFTALIPAYPHMQARAQAELDRVVGRTRLPTPADEPHLPYCHALIKEIERRHNPFWLGTPHMASEDFVYTNTNTAADHPHTPTPARIRKGSVVVLNTYSMHHDASRWADPLAFNPDRYLGDATLSSASANLGDARARDHWMFGAGRRVCPGMWVAEREIWLAVSRLLWAFDMVQIEDKPIDLNEYDGLSGRSPVPFEIVLRERFGGVGEVIERELGGFAEMGMGVKAE
ncbi:cytochrome P450 [Massariosphaeria phaeospora]|uniref:Cytochrome P450 n=1 Tax=Massariosphaeria phaeospora TaxID=100035 RepID=A0A7C8M4N4_9PLEO|nr:cytochrome P450 [Massariosphaeria phaeospora]